MFLDCNSVDIGAQIGKNMRIDKLRISFNSPLFLINLADVFPGGRVIAFEMGPPVEILRLNVR